MTPQTSIIDFIGEQLRTDPKDSKKFIAMQFGIFSVLIVAATAGLIFVLGPATVAGSAAIVAQIAITAIGGLVATYIGGQAVVEFKANAVLNTSAQVNPTTLQPGSAEAPMPVVVANPEAIPVVETHGGSGGTGQRPPNSLVGSTGTPPPKPFGATATQE